MCAELFSLKAVMERMAVEPMKTEKELDTSSLKKEHGFFSLGQRHFLAIMGFFGIFNIYTMRINLSVAIVAMVAEPVKNISSNLTSFPSKDVCPFPDDAELSDSSSHPSSHKESEFDWDSETQGLLLGSYFYGYIATQMLGGWIAKRYGGKYPFGIGILLCAILTLVTPIAAHVHYGLLLAIRIGEGLATNWVGYMRFGDSSRSQLEPALSSGTTLKSFVKNKVVMWIRRKLTEEVEHWRWSRFLMWFAVQGFCYPALQQMLSQWSPSMERTKLSTLANAGAPAGNVVVFAVSGFLGQHLGWESIFYVFGGIGVAWWILWQLFVYETPHKHPRTTKYEVDLITGSKVIVTAADQAKVKARKVPWVKLMTSLPVWAMILAHIGQNWGNYTLLTNLPNYMKNILHFNLSANGVFSALPYLALWLFSITSGYLSDYLRESRTLSTTNVRKLFNTIGNVIPMVALVAVGYVGCDVVAAVALLTIATGFSGCTQCSYQVNSLDLSPVFASLIFGFSNTFANVPGIVSPYTVGLITAGEDGQTISNWRIIFYISGVIRLVTLVFYLIFASGETLPWNSESEEPVGYQ